MCFNPLFSGLTLKGQALVRVLHNLKSFNPLFSGLTLKERDHTERWIANTLAFTQ